LRQLVAIRKQTTSTKVPFGVEPASLYEPLVVVSEKSQEILPHIPRYKNPSKELRRDMEGGAVPLCLELRMATVVDL
jgi:hypothetical protein